MTQSQLSDDNTGKLIAKRYLLIECIGEGGMGMVYRADDQKLLRSVAIKLLQEDFGSRPDAESRFRREATIGAQLSHPNIVRTYDFGRDGDNLYLVMEFLAGKNLSDYMQSKRQMPLREALSVAIQVCDGMASAHEKHLIHRDLKPENILVMDGYPLVCKVVDFGMARATEGSADMARLTAEGVVGGTPMYMAPEQLCGKEPRGASDVYSFACILFLMITGAPPYSSTSLGELAAHHLYAPIPDIPATFTNIAPVLRELIHRCLAKHPGTRPTMQQVCDRLKRIIDNKPRSKPAKSPTNIALAPVVSTNTQRVALRGGPDPQVLIAITAAGMEVIQEDALTDGDALVSFGETTGALSSLSTTKLLVIVDSELNDMNRISDLLRLGVQEVISRPVRPDDVVTKLRRAFRSRRHRTKTSS